MSPVTSPGFTIVDETDDYVVVDKPPFLLAHPTKPNGESTLWKELQELLAFELANGGQVSIINRLDRETSGLVLIAKTAAAARRYGMLMQQHRVKKEYLAIVWGWPEWETKFVDAPLGRQGKFGEWSRGDASDIDGRPEEVSFREKANQSAIWLKQAIHPTGAAARTEFRVERRFEKILGRDGPLGRPKRSPSGAPGGRSLPIDKFSLIRAIPHTGRTHQIRVHLASSGHPVVGDKIYGPDERLYLQFIETGWTPELEQQLLLPRHALHSSKLVIDGEIEWESPLSVDLRDFVSYSGDL
jgi:23S rRNA pseudouridine1911/1915/1917 synthase